MSGTKVPMAQQVQDESMWAESDEGMLRSIGGPDFSVIESTNDHDAPMDNTVVKWGKEKFQQGLKMAGEMAKTYLYREGARMLGPGFGGGGAYAPPQITPGQGFFGANQVKNL